MLSFLKIEINKKRIYGLDILRAIAIIFVVLEHSTYTLRNSNSDIVKEISGAYSWYLNYFVFDGVSIFFVLSGFLIGGILIKCFDNQQISLKILINFWIKRWARTLPAYLFVLSLLVLLNCNFSKDFNFYEAVNYYFFIQNFNAPHPDFFPEAWSLSVEEWFYLLIPSSIFLFSWLFNIPFKKILITSAVVVLLFSTLMRYEYFSSHLINTHEDWSLLLRKQVITRLDSLMFGLLGAYLYYYHNSLWLKHKTLSFVLGIIILLSNKYLPWNDALYINVFSFSVYSTAILLLLPFLNNLESGKGFFYKLLTYISLISYSMYLLNLSIIQDWILYFFPLLISNAILLASVKFFCYWFLLFFLSILMYKYIERPFMDIRNKFEVK